MLWYPNTVYTLDTVLTAMTDQTNQEINPPKRNSHGGKRPGAGRKPMPAYDREAYLEACRSYTPAAVKRLADIAMKSKSENMAIKACEALLNRAWGSPPQSVAIDAHVTNSVDQVDDRHLALAVLALLRESGMEMTDITPLIASERQPVGPPRLELVDDNRPIIRPAGDLLRAGGRS